MLLVGTCPIREMYKGPDTYAGSLRGCQSPAYLLKEYSVPVLCICVCGTVMCVCVSVVEEGVILPRVCDSAKGV